MHIDSPLLPVKLHFGYRWKRVSHRTRNLKDLVTYVLLKKKYPPITTTTTSNNNNYYNNTLQQGTTNNKYDNATRNNNTKWTTTQSKPTVQKSKQMSCWSIRSLCDVKPFDRSLLNKQQQTTQRQTAQVTNGSSIWSKPDRLVVECFVCFSRLFSRESSVEVKTRSPLENRGPK